MKRTLIVAAISTLAATGALAQSSVTIYGRLNTTLESIDRDGVKTKELVNNGSRLGFKGTEDLGGGLKANFLLEHRFNSDTGTSSSSAFWAGDAYVGLAGGFGMIRLGRMTSEAYFATSDYIGMHNHETGDSSDALYAYLGRNTNKISYRTPELVKGLTAEVAVSLGEGQAGEERNTDIAVNYGSGPLHLGFGYEKGNGDAKQFAGSFLYEMGSFVIGGLVQRDTDGWGAGLGSRTNYRGSLAYNVGASEFHLNVGKSGDYSKVADSDAMQYTLGYNYNLSKRTKVYGYYTKLDASNGTPYAADFNALAVGVRHNF
jgi:predicted porin